MLIAAGEETVTMQNRVGLAFYAHAGSGNHGCEAIADSLARQLNASMAVKMGQKEEDCFRPGVSEIQDGLAPFSKTVTLMSERPKEDERYYTGTLFSVEPTRRLEDHFYTHLLYYGYRKISGDDESFLRYRFRAITGAGAPRLAVSIGGDNYCYENQIPDLMRANRMLNRQGTATMLLGCSVEPKLLTKEHAELIADMKRYKCITVRETMSYEALIDAGISRECVVLLPDPAFSLPTERSGWMPQVDTVGINLSPLIENYATEKGTAFNGYKTLIKHILDTSDCDIALIPHVVWNGNDDRTPLRGLYEMFGASGRVKLVEDAPAEKLKGVIAGCRLFVGARTHATIAAYSSCVPTLTVGYSVKARGIARDLFGTAEHFVLPIQELQSGRQLVEAFEWMRENEQEIRNKLHAIMPAYVSRARENGRQILRVYDACGNNTEE